MIKTILMNLKILLPFKVFAEIKNVKKIVIETNAGSFGLLPQRLDFTASIVPGILAYRKRKRRHEICSIR